MCRQPIRWTKIKLVYPPAIDIGVDHLSDLTGSGVTVAVVDSGVYVDALINLYLGQKIGDAVCRAGGFRR